MTGENDPDCRKAFDWDPAHWDMDLREHYKKLMTLRKTRKALQEGSVRFCSQGEVFAMERRWSEERLITVINNTPEKHSWTFQGRSAKDLLGGETYQSENGTIALEMGAFSAQILEINE